MYPSIITIIVLIPIFFGPSLADVQAFEMFGIDILAGTRSQITEAILQCGAQKLPSNNPLIDRYDANAIFPGAQMKVGFTVDEELQSIVCQFDSGSWFTDVLKFDELKKSLVEKHGRPVVSPAEDRNSDFEKELKWTKNEIKIQLVSYKWFAAWRIHVTHRLSYHIRAPSSLNMDPKWGQTIQNITLRSFSDQQ